VSKSSIARFQYSVLIDVVNRRRRRLTTSVITLLNSQRVRRFASPCDALPPVVIPSSDFLHKNYKWLCEYAVPGEPRKVRVEVLNSTAVRLEWRPPSDRELNGIVRGYRVHYVPLGHLDEPLVNVPPTRLDLADGLRTEVVVTGLRPDSVYQFEVEAYTRRGPGERSRPRKIRTKGAGSFVRFLLRAEVQPILDISAETSY